MKYSKGNKVIIIKCPWTDTILKILDSNSYILTVKGFKKNRLETFYIMEETGLATWSEGYIEGLYIKPEPIVSRFEILDL